MQRMWLAGVLLIAFSQHSLSRSTQMVEAEPAFISVGRNVQVSKSRSNQWHTEVLMASDPENRNHLLACSMVNPQRPSRPMYAVVVYASFDGGATWQETLQVAEGWATGDPACAYGPGGVAYVAMIARGRKPDGKDSEVLFFKSQDAGMTWTRLIDVPITDREYVTVDNTLGKYRGRVYLHGTASVRALDSTGKNSLSLDLWRSSDAGATILGPSKVIAIEPNLAHGMGNGVVHSDSTFIALTTEMLSEKGFENTRPYKPNGRIVALASEDGGRSFSRQGIVGTWYIDIEHYSTCTSLPMLAVDSSTGPFKDRLYAVWSDLRSGRMELVLAYSSDKGKSWSTPIVVGIATLRTDWPDAPDNCAATVAINADGVVGVMWYERRDDADYTGYWPRFSASLDGGETFMPTVKLSPDPLSPRDASVLPLLADNWGGGSHSPFMRSAPLHFSVSFDRMQFAGGDTSGLVATADGVFHALWVEKRNGRAQVWTAPISVRGRAIKYGSEELANLSDVTARVGLALGEPVYDRSKGILTLDAYIENTSNSALKRPMVIRLLFVKPMMGEVRVTNSDNQFAGAGAVWDFSAQLDNGTLPAGGRSRPKRLEFQFTEFPATRSLKAMRQILEVQCKVLAKSESTDSTHQQK